MSDIVNDPKQVFSTFISERSDLLKQLEAKATEFEIPIVGPVVGELLYILVKAVNARHVLELGTASGYSAIYMAEAMDPENGKLITIDKSAHMAKVARETFQKAGLSGRIDILEGDSLDILCEMKDPFDFIFLDIDKQFYKPVLPQCHRLLKKGGLLVADNVAFVDAQDFNRTIFKDDGWKTVHLLCYLPRHSPENDGLCLAVRV